MGGGLILAVRPKCQDCIECNPKADIQNTFAVSILSIQKLLDHLMCEAAAK